MADELPLPVDRLPTLTEVLELDNELRAPGAGVADWAPALPQPVLPATAQEGLAAPVPGPMPVALGPAAHQGLDEQFLVDRVLTLLMPRIDVLLESRVSEALAPALAQAADMLIRESRDELLRALRGLAEESLAQVLRQSGHNHGRDDTRG